MGAYRVVFSGKIQEGKSFDEVRASVARLFKASEEKAGALLSGGVRTVRAGLSEAEARRYVSALYQAGCLCRAEPEDLGAPAAPAPTPAEAAMTCPKCGLAQLPAEECAGCGVLVRKFAQAAGRAADPEQFVRQVVAAYKPRFKGTQFRFAPDIPPDLLAEAVGAYTGETTVWVENPGGRGLEPDEEILLVVENGVMAKTAKSNLLLTTRKLYNSLTVLAQMCHACPLQDIRSVALAGWTKSTLKVNGRDVEVMTHGEEGEGQNRQLFAEMLSEIARTLALRASARGGREAIDRLAPPAPPAPTPTPAPSAPQRHTSVPPAPAPGPAPLTAASTVSVAAEAPPVPQPPVPAARAKSPGRGNMIAGAIWCVGGIAVTVGSYVAAEPGGKFMLAWGAVIFGAIQFFKGLADYVRNS